MPITKLKTGYEAIKYVLKKVLTKKGVKGIATIPGKAYDMRMKQLTDEMALKMKALGYDINKVTEKNVQGLLDSAEALEKQQLKVTPKITEKTTLDDLLTKPHTDERGRTWDFGTKDRPFPGWKPKIVPKDDLASGGIARLGMAGGGALFNFIEKLFIKASNDIRLGKGKWKGLDQKQKPRLKQE